jgi:hypothetical protein
MSIPVLSTLYLVCKTGHDIAFKVIIYNIAVLLITTSNLFYIIYYP